jgi:hypothetical protein
MFEGPMLRRASEILKSFLVVALGAFRPTKLRSLRLKYALYL